MSHTTALNMAPSQPAALPVLYSFRRCPYAMRARLALRASGLPVVLREVVLRNKPTALLLASPKGTVPVLQQPDGEVIDQSLDIMRWALSQHDPQGWLRHADAAASQAEAHALIELNDGPFKALLDAYKYPERHPHQSAAQHRDQGMALLMQPLEARLSQHAAVLGPHTSLVDMALLPFVRQWAQVDAHWFAGAPLPALKRWLQHHVNSALFESVMRKEPPWQPGAAEVLL